jgi:hypothetical protein
MLTGRFRLSTFTFAVGLSVGAAPALTQEAPRLVAARSFVEIGGLGGSAFARLEYALEGGMGGAGLQLRLLGFGEATVDSVTVWIDDGEPTWVRLTGDGGAARFGSLEVPGSGPQGAWSVRLEYQVRAGVTGQGRDFSARVPMAVLGADAEEADPGRFVAEVSLPPEWRVAESFPSNLERASAVWTASLPVVPSALRLAGSTDGSRRLSPTGLAEVMIVLTLLIAAVVGLRHLRGLGA